MTKIIVPIDFGDHSKFVFHYALEIAKKTKSTIALYHTVHLPHTERSRLVEYGKAMDTAVAVNQRRLTSFKKENLPEEFAKIPIEVVVEKGHSASGIINFTKRALGDIIVMGLTNRSHWEDILFGSVSKIVLSKATCPVLLIHRDVELLPFNNVLYFFHLGPSHLGKLPRVANFTSNWEHKTFVHFTVEKDMDEKELERQKKKLLNLFKGVKNIEFDEVKKDGNFRKTFTSFLEQQQISLLILQHHDQVFQKLMHDKESNLVRKVQLPILFMPKRVSMGSFQASRL
jgi:nucleotide-binding universal stress UspA family protein